MFRSASTARLTLSFSCLALALVGVRAASADPGALCGSAPEACDFQEKRTTLRPQIWSGDCNPALWNSLPATGFPILDGVLATGPRAPVHFLTGVCELHRAGGDVDNGISELQKAQTYGLLPSQRNVAALFEGLLHCKKLNAIDKTRISKSVATRDEFCTHRAMAKASFGSASFASLELAYQDVPSPSLGSHIEAMSQCYGDYLHGGYDATCAVISAPAPSAVTEAAVRTSDEVLTGYFGNADGTASTGDTGVPPLKAMLARKIQMADTSIQASTAMFDGLQKKNALLTTSFQSLGSMFCLPTGEDGEVCAGPIPGRVSKVYDAYQRSVVKSQSVLGFVDQWVNGLYEYKGKDVRADLKVGTKALGDVLARVQHPVQPNEQSLSEKIHLVQRDMAVLANSADAQQKIVRSVCSVYFCEVRNRKALFFKNACDQVDAVTHVKVSVTNKLCDPVPTRTFLSGDSGATAYSVCQAAAFPKATMDAQTMSPTDVDACMTTYHN